MFSSENTFLVLIDVQEKLTAAMYNPSEVAANIVRFVRGIQALEIPIFMTEQNPSALGPTINPLRDLLRDSNAITKLSFSCCGEEAFVNALLRSSRRQALVCGLECHVCVYQTVADLVAMGYDVQVVSDCVSSRTMDNKKIGLEKCRETGASITSVETILFELVRKAEGTAFKKILALVK